MTVLARAASAASVVTPNVRRFMPVMPSSSEVVTRRSQGFQASAQIGHVFVDIVPPGPLQCQRGAGRRSVAARGTSSAARQDTSRHECGQPACVAGLPDNLRGHGIFMTNEIPRTVANELAPGGTLRVAINFGNSVLAQRDPAGGPPRGVSGDLARELARRLDLPIEYVPSMPRARCSRRSRPEPGTSPSWRSTWCARKGSRSRHRTW